MDADGIFSAYHEDGVEHIDKVLHNEVTGETITADQLNDSDWVLLTETDYPDYQHPAFLQKSTGQILDSSPGAKVGDWVLMSAPDSSHDHMRIIMITDPKMVMTHDDHHADADHETKEDHEHDDDSTAESLADFFPRNTWSRPDLKKRDQSSSDLICSQSNLLRKTLDKVLAETGETRFCSLRSGVNTRVIQAHDDHADHDHGPEVVPRRRKRHSPDSGHDPAEYLELMTTDLPNHWGFDDGRDHFEQGMDLTEDNL